MAKVAGNILIKGNEASPSQLRGPLVESAFVKTQVASALGVNNYEWARFNCSSIVGLSKITLKKANGEIIASSSFKSSGASQNSRVHVWRDDTQNTDHSTGDFTEWSLVDGDYLIEFEIYGEPREAQASARFPTPLSALSYTYSGHGTTSFSLEFSISA